MIKILLVDDHIAVAEGTKAILEQSGKFKVTTCYDYDTTNQMIEDESFDVYLLDLYMPKISGIEMSKKILEKLPDAKILIYTGFDLRSHFNLLIDAGVSGFLSKEASIEQIIRSIEAVLRDEVILPVDIFSELRRTQITNKTMQDDVLENIELTKREHDILAAISKGLTNKEISQELLLSQRSVEYSLTNIFSKLKVKSRTEALLKAKQYNLLTVTNIYE